MCCEPDESVTRAGAAGADPAADRHAVADPGAGAPGTGETMGRRAWMSRLSLALGAIATAVVGLPLVGFIFAPFFGAKPERWRAVGHVSRFPVGTTTVVTFEDPSPLRWSGQVARTAAWLRHESESEFIAFSVDCTHLGCPVRWEDKANLFMCPCHGGVYYSNGNVAGGPPPHPLPRYPVRVRGDAVEIRTTPLPITT